MADKVTVEEINATLALERMKRREMLLKTLRGGGWELFLSTLVQELVRTLPAFTLACGLSYLEQKPEYLVFFTLVLLMQLYPTKDRRLDALIELLEIDKPSTANVIPSQKNEKS